MSDDNDNIVEFKKPEQKQVTSQQAVIEFLNNIELDSITVFGSLEGWPVLITDCNDDVEVTKLMHSIIESLMMGDMEDVTDEE